ncbi:MAG TPA: glycoside hydrolase family 30 beta sandwich domain-containing protein, partial [Puia sp.]|nr:glycoside hydrolase family 30 beta sandwich domain-containing protein [Puia sp.]
YWITKGDQSVLLQQQADLKFGVLTNAYPFIDVDSTQKFQSIDGFGYTLTGGSAYLINRMNDAEKSALLQELFSANNTSISISYLRLSVGSSDLNASVFSYDDMPSGQTDTALGHFSIDPDKTDLVPLLKQILLINPSIKIIATAWSAPSWMKTNGNTIGGSLQPGYFSIYAKYYVKYIQAMKAEGITIDAIAPQNEPLNPNNNPSMVMSAADQLVFVKNNLGPSLQAAGLSTKIVLYDHNCDVPDYPLTILHDADARKYADGSAFHLYAGDISALSLVHNAYPDKNIYFTEQYTASTGDFAGDLRWHLKNVIIGSMRNWSRNALEWNLANDPAYNPHTPGGCTTCKGALTINGNAVTRNVAYYIIAHASKFVVPGSIRIASNLTNNLQNVALLTPSGKKVLIVENDGNDIASFNIRFKGQWVTTTLAAGAVGTYTW